MSSEKIQYKPPRVCSKGPDPATNAIAEYTVPQGPIYLLDPKAPLLLHSIYLPDDHS